MGKKIDKERLHLLLSRIVRIIEEDIRERKIYSSNLHTHTTMLKLAIEEIKEMIKK